MPTVRIPATLATKKGAAYLADQATRNTVVVTNHGKPTAVVMSPEEYDEHLRILRDAAHRMTSGIADLLAERSTFLSVAEARARLHETR